MLGKYLSRLCVACFENPRRSLGILLLSFLVSVLFGASSLKLRLAWTFLFDRDDRIVREFEEARDLFPYPGDIAILVDQGSAEEREQFLDLVAKEMSKEPEVYHHVFYRLELAAVRERALYFLEQDLLETVEGALSDATAFSRESLVSESAVKIQLKLLNDLKTALLTRGRGTLVPVWRMFTKDAGQQVAETLYKLLNGDRYVYASIADNKVHVLFFKGGTRGSKLAGDGREVKKVRELLHRLHPASYGLRVRLTGIPVMLHDERETCAGDSLRSGALSLVLIAMVFTAGFGGWRKPLFSLAGLVCGLGWTLAYAALTVGHLNFITVTMVSMLMGLGIDFGIHFLFRFEEYLRKEHSCAEAIDLTARTTGVDTLVGAAATAAAFGALTVTDFRGVADLGVIASGGILLCFLSTVTVLPSLLGLSPCQKTSRLPQASILEDLEEWLREHSKLVLSLTALVFLAGLYFVGRVDFSYNLLEIQAQELAVVQTEKEMLTSHNCTVLSGAVLVKGLDEARRVSQKLKSLGTVGQVGTITDLLPPVTPKKREVVEKIVAATRELEVPEPVALDRARDLLDLQAKLAEIERKTESMVQDPDVVRAVDEVKSVVADMNPGPLQDGLKSFQRSVLKDFTKVLRLLKAQQAEPPALEQLPEELLVRYVNDEGYYLLSVQPRVNIWQRENLQRFLQEVDSTGVTLVGHPVVQSHILSSFDRAFQVTPWYTLIGVLSVMLLYLKRPGPILLSFLPTALGVYFIFTVMGAGGTDFNVVNFVALPISVGIGAVYGVHALHRLEWESSLLASSTGYAILLSGLTTIAGFSSLILAHHRGLSSFGYVISVGVLANLLVSLFILPAFVRVVRPALSSRSSERAE